MSKTAEDVSATLTQEERANLSDVDQIAELLVGDDDETEDETGEETQTAASNQEDEETTEVSDDDDDDGEDEEGAQASADDEELTWSKLLGVDDSQMSFDDEGNLVGFVAKVNGEATTLTPADLLANYQTNKAVTTKGQALAEERKAFEEQREQAQNEYVSKLQSVELLTKHFEKQLISEYDNVNWEQLSSEDPARYAAMRLDFQQKAGELKQIQEAIAKDQQAEMEKFQQDMSGRQQTYLKQQFDAMIEKNPEWADKKVLDEARAGFKSFVNETYGFTEQEFDSVFDARLIELIKDAKRFHEALKVAGKKRQTPVPRFQKSVGGKKQKVPSKVEKLTAASRKAVGQQKRDLQTSAVAELLMGNE